MEKQLPGQKFRDFLREELKSRVQKNPNYSLRSLARNLGISASGLSMVMGGKKPVTLNFINKVGSKLNIDAKALQAHQLSLLTEKLNIDYKLKEYETIDLETFAVIKDWYHYAILNLMRTKEFKPQASWIAKRLGISLGEVQTAIENLQKVKILKISNGKWTDTSTLFTSHTNNSKSHEAAKQNQIQLFEKATQAIREIDFEKRNHTGSTMAISLKDMDSAKRHITKFRKEFMAKFDRESKADEVYHLSVAFFPLTKK